MAFGPMSRLLCFRLHFIPHGLRQCKDLTANKFCCVCATLSLSLSLFFVQQQNIIKNNNGWRLGQREKDKIRQHQHQEQSRQEDKLIPPIVFLRPIYCFGIFIFVNQGGLPGREPNPCLLSS